jgi:antitoxin (DNA-binding transcriptional repressor) of toxin-antitoxin stability system
LESAAAEVAARSFVQEQVLWEQRLAEQSSMEQLLMERPWEPAVAAWARSSELAVERQLSAQQEVAWVQLLVALAEARHGVALAEAAERLSVQQVEVAQQGEQAARVVPLAQRPGVRQREARHAAAEQLSAVRVERPLVALSEQPSDLQELVRRLARQ